MRLEHRWRTLVSDRAVDEGVSYRSVRGSGWQTRATCGVRRLRRRVHPWTVHELPQRWTHAKAGSTVWSSFLAQTVELRR